jgi:hypothetical protein
MSSEKEDLILPKESAPTQDVGTTVDMTTTQFNSETSVQIPQ